MAKKEEKQKKEAPQKKEKIKAPKEEVKPKKALTLPKGPSPLEKKYKEEVAPLLIKQFHYKNNMQCPRLTRIVVNTSLKEALQDPKILDKALLELAQITGQRPFLTLAKKSISNFKLRAGQPIGCAVTLRKRYMYEFFNRLVNIVLPRVRDFKGVSPKGFDGRGNYTLGLTEQTIFPEIHHDKVDKIFGMNVTFVTTAGTNEEGKTLLKTMGMPFREITKE